MNALELQGVTKKVGDFRLDDISFCLPKGYIMGYVGRNGAGKTTTIRLITRQYTHGEGTICINGKQYDEDPIAYLNSIGYISDECYFPKEYTVEMVENTLSDCYPSFQKDVFHMYVKRWSLPRNRKIHDFSKGMKLRLMLAGVLSRDTDVLILDEATSGLDPVLRKEILRLLREYICDGTHSVLISTHILEDLEMIADYICLIDQGKIILMDTLEQLKENYVFVRGGHKEKIDIRKYLIGMEKTSYGYAGLLSTDYLEYTSSEIVIEPATIQQIVVSHIEERGGCFG